MLGPCRHPKNLLVRCLSSHPPTAGPPKNKLSRSAAGEGVSFAGATTHLCMAMPAPLAPEVSGNGILEPAIPYVYAPGPASSYLTSHELLDLAASRQLCCLSCSVSNKSLLDAQSAAKMGGQFPQPDPVTHLEEQHGSKEQH